MRKKMESLIARAFTKKERNSKWKAKHDDDMRVEREKVNEGIALCRREKTGRKKKENETSCGLGEVNFLPGNPRPRR